MGAHLDIIPEVFAVQQLGPSHDCARAVRGAASGLLMLVCAITVTAWAGKALCDVNLTRRFAVQVDSIDSAWAGDFNFVPKADTLLAEGDGLVFLGHAEHLQGQPIAPDFGPSGGSV